MEKYRITQQIGEIKTTTETTKLSVALKILQYGLELNPHAKLTIEKFKITEK